MFQRSAIVQTDGQYGRCEVVSVPPCLHDASAAFTSGSWSRPALTIRPSGPRICLTGSGTESEAEGCHRRSTGELVRRRRRGAESGATPERADKTVLRAGCVVRRRDGRGPHVRWRRTGRHRAAQSPSWRRCAREARRPRCCRARRDGATSRVARRTMRWTFRARRGTTRIARRRSWHRSRPSTGGAGARRACPSAVPGSARGRRPR